MAEIPKEITTSCIVKSKAQAEDGWVVELDVPKFQSKFPTKCTRVAEDVAARLVVGATLELELVRESLKKDTKTGAMKSGTYWTDYYWGFRELATATQPPKLAPILLEGPPEQGDPKQVSIERQKAAQIAFDWAEGEAIEVTLARAEAIYAWISKSPEARSEPQSAPSRAKAPSGPPPASELGASVGSDEPPENPALAGMVAEGQKRNAGPPALPAEDRPASVETFKKMEAVITKYGAKVVAIKNYYKVGNLADMTENQVLHCIAWLERPAGQKAVPGR